VQAAELAFATGARMLQADQRAAYEGREVARVVERLFDGRVAVHEGDATLAPGLTVHVLPGHTPGLQGVRVRTPAGFVLLASDAAHFYRTVETATPFAIFADLGGALAGAERVRSLCGDDGWWVPGHDPEVMRRFEPAPPGEAVRLDQPRMHDRSQL
jgi:glyoxylase-like metal-dependent hydrolase (beta-lactamase superfamily II)